MHARAVVARIGLGHEGGCFAVGIGHVPDHVLQHLSPVGALHQGAKAGANLVLASACHLVVEHLNRDAQRLKNERHFSAHVLGAVDRGHWKVAALDSGTVAPVAAFELGTRTPRGFVFVDLKEHLAWLIAPAHAVKNEEFRLGAKEGRVANAGSLEVGLGPLGNRAGIAVIRLAVAGLDHIALHEQRGFFKERVQIGGVGVGHELHV